MRTIMSPLECFAETGVSIKVFMPLLYDKLLMLDCKAFGFREFARLHPNRLSKSDFAFHDKNRFAIPPLHMNVYWGVVVTVEEEAISVLWEHPKSRFF